MKGEAVTIIAILAIVAFLATAYPYISSTGYFKQYPKLPVIPSPPFNCTDSDANEIYRELVNGMTAGYDWQEVYVENTDYCSSNASLIEYYCNNNVVDGTQITCYGGCVNGACIYTSSCPETDITTEYPDGRNPYVKGEFAGFYDSCIDDNTLYERYCSGIGTNAQEHISCSYSCSNGLCTNCTDVDGGKTYNIQGTTANVFYGVIFYPIFTDICLKDNHPPYPGQENILYEGYCDEQGIGRFEEYDCPNYCQNGRCVDEIITCTDYDSGKEYYIKSYVRDNSGLTWDGCRSDYDVAETFCTEYTEQGVAVQELYYCPNGCVDGECIPDYESLQEFYDDYESYYESTVSNEPMEYLGPYIDFITETEWTTYQPIIDKVNELTDGLTSDYDKTISIANWVRNSKEFRSPEYSSNSIITIFNADHGTCYQAAVLTTAMIRLAGIPARVSIKAESSHALTESFVEGKWLGIDSTFVAPNVQDAQLFYNISGVEHVVLNNEGGFENMRTLNSVIRLDKPELNEVWYYMIDRAYFDGTVRRDKLHASPVFSHETFDINWGKLIYLDLGYNIQTDFIVLGDIESENVECTGFCCYIKPDESSSYAGHSDFKRILHSYFKGMFFTVKNNIIQGEEQKTLIPPKTIRTLPPGKYRFGYKLQNDNKLVAYTDINLLPGQEIFIDPTMLIKTENINQEIFDAFIEYLEAFSSTHCGDTICDTGETCSTCSQDCGTCSCSDSDEGLNHYEKGETIGIRYPANHVISTFNDQCHKYVGYYEQVTSCNSPDCYVNEFYCDASDYVKEVMIPCKYSCSNGLCTTCTDSDGGKIYTTKGTTTNISITKIDSCVDVGKVTEYYCSNNNVLSEVYVCPGSCSDGKCISTCANVNQPCTSMACCSGLVCTNGYCTKSGVIPTSTEPTPETGETVTIVQPTPTIWARIVNFFRSLFA